jgi:integrase
MRSADGSIKLVAKGVYRVRITVGYDPETGKQVWASKNVRGTRKTAEDAKDALKRQYRTANSVVYGRMSVYQLVKEDIERRDLAETTLRGYHATLKNHIRGPFENLRVSELRKFHIQAALRAIKTDGARLNAYKLLHGALSEAKANEWIVSNPIAGIEQPTLPEHTIEAYELDELISIMEYARGTDIEPGVIVAEWCGTRASETCGLDRTDLTLVCETVAKKKVYHGHVDVHEGYHALPGKRVMTDTKTERSNRVVALPGFAVKRLLEILGEARIGPLMMDATGQRMTPGGFSHRWRRLMQVRHNKTGEVIYQPPVRYLPLMQLRHSRATVALELGENLSLVSRDLGHSLERTTDTLYVKRRRRPNYVTAAAFDKAVKAHESTEKKRKASRHTAS